MLKVLSHNSLKIYKYGAGGINQQLRDVFKISCNCTIISNSLSTRPALKPQSYTFKQNRENSEKVTPFGWIMLVRNSDNFYDKYLR